MKTGKIAAIEGVYLNRKIGDKSLIDAEGLDHDSSEKGVIGPYSQRNWDGEQLRSFTAVLRSDDGEAGSQVIGFLCVNCRTSAFAAATIVVGIFKHSQ